MVDGERLIAVEMMSGSLHIRSHDPHLSLLPEVARVSMSGAALRPHDTARRRTVMGRDSKVTDTPIRRRTILMRIAGVFLQGKPLSPTTPAKARKLINSKDAIPKRNKPGRFYIQLTTPTAEHIPHDTVVGVDPGKQYAGIGVQTPHAMLWMGLSDFR